MPDTVLLTNVKHYACRKRVINEGLGRGKRVHHDLPLFAFATLL